tara:strand:- start:5570 stop:6064 length:495 start_codon:yes stop_codon:yes gene_type:complete
MEVFSGQSENGWEKSVLKGDIIQYKTVLTHTVSTSSNQVTGLFPSEVIKHLYKQFSNLHLTILWSATKTTTVNLLLLDPRNQVIQVREIIASGSHNTNTSKGAMIVPKNLYSSDGAFVDTTNLLSPYMILQDLASSGTNTPDVTLIINFASDSSRGLKTIGDNI